MRRTATTTDAGAEEQGVERGAQARRGGLVAARQAAPRLRLGGQEGEGWWGPLRCVRCLYGRGQEGEGEERREKGGGAHRGKIVFSHCS